MKKYVIDRGLASSFALLKEGGHFLCPIVSLIIRA